MPCRLAEQAGVLRRESKTSVFVIRVIAGILVFAAVSSPGVAQEKGKHTVHLRKLDMCSMYCMQLYFCLLFKRGHMQHKDKE